MNINFGILFAVCLPMLAFYSYRNYTHIGTESENTLSVLFWKASGWVSVGFLFYGAPSLIAPGNSSFLSAATAIANICNAIGFSYFLLVPIYRRFSKYYFEVARHLLFINIAFFGGLSVLLPSHTIIDPSGVIVWNIPIILAVAMTTLITVAFALNLFMIWRELRRLRFFSLMNAVALMTTFGLSGLGGAYLYFGNNVTLLAISSSLLYLGISVIFVTSLHGYFMEKRESARLKDPMTWNTGRTP